jgi:hypothetical protein
MTRHILVCAAFLCINCDGDRGVGLPGPEGYEFFSGPQNGYEAGIHPWTCGCASPNPTQPIPGPDPSPKPGQTPGQPPPSTCGNAQIDPGEQCDFGLYNFDPNFRCHPNTCLALTSF